MPQQLVSWYEGVLHNIRHVVLMSELICVYDHMNYKKLYATAKNVPHFDCCTSHSNKHRFEEHYCRNNPEKCLWFHGPILNLNVDSPMVTINPCLGNRSCMFRYMWSLTRVFFLTDKQRMHHYREWKHINSLCSFLRKKHDLGFARAMLRWATVAT